MIIENTPESVLEAKKLLGLPADYRIGFVRRDGELLPCIMLSDGRRFTVGDEVTA